MSVSSTPFEHTKSRATAEPLTPTPNFGVVKGASWTPHDDTHSAPFERLWKAFMAARVLVAVALLSLVIYINTSNASVPFWILGVGVAYLIVGIATFLLASPQGPGIAFDKQWFFALAPDIALFLALQAHQFAGVNYTLLLAFPVLIAGTLGSKLMAFGTGALVSLALLGLTVWQIDLKDSGVFTYSAQTGLTGAGVMLLAVFTHQLSTRLAREQTLLLRSQMATHMQAWVNTLIIASLKNGVLVVDSNGTVLNANPSACRMLMPEQDNAEATFNLRDSLAWSPLVEIVESTFRMGAIDETDITLHLDYQESSHLLVRTKRTPALDPSMQTLCVVFLQDLREIEAKLRTEKLASMGRMSAAVAHEIRNPLAAISQANALLSEELTKPEHQRLAAMIDTSAQRLGHIVEDVLNTARVHDVSNPDAAQTLELDAITSMFCAEWAHQHQAQERLRLTLQANDVAVCFAHEHLRRVLINLLDNAARYAEQSIASIQVNTYAVRYGPPTLVVWSNSSPIEESVRRHLFEPFFSSETRSSGLGLFICRELCERHGAHIHYQRTQRAVQGQPVNGNEFLITFRRAHSMRSQLQNPL